MSRGAVICCKNIFSCSIYSVQRLTAYRTHTLIQFTSGFAVVDKKKATRIPKRFATKHCESNIHGLRNIRLIKRGVYKTINVSLFERHVHKSYLKFIASRLRVNTWILCFPSFRRYTKKKKKHADICK